MQNAELYPPCQLTLTFPPLGKGGFATGNHRPFRQGADMMSCVCSGDIIYDEGRAENVPINYNVTLLQLFYKLNILLKFLEFCCIIKMGVGDFNARQDFLTVFTPAVMPSLLYSQAEMPSL